MIIVEVAAPGPPIGRIGTRGLGKTENGAPALGGTPHKAGVGVRVGAANPGANGRLGGIGTSNKPLLLPSAEAKGLRAEVEVRTPKGAFLVPSAVNSGIIKVKQERPTLRDKGVAVRIATGVKVEKTAKARVRTRTRTMRCSRLQEVDHYVAGPGRFLPPWSTSLEVVLSLPLIFQIP